MTTQPRPYNSIEQRKQDVRKYTRNAAVSVVGGVAGGLALFVLTSSTFLLIVGLIVAVVGGWTNWSKVQKIVNHKDNY
ncbi:hypothetical protein [Corynebacterium ulcerans]|uniref:hypothetical protein n=1 Tax=Corynebacterium ulcerans TaxID=65058 RepID=UPI0018D7621D|nr:hypothetical protein [Corynebacterium ulcerans]MBH5302622.1 hypothetical protein [Corynebacterium ulcerans]